MSHRCIIGCLVFVLVLSGGLFAVHAQRRVVERENQTRRAPLTTAKTVIDTKQIAGADKIIKIDPSLLNAGANFKIADVSAFENTAVVIAPNKNNACPNGKIITNTGEPLGIYTRDLNQINDPSVAPTKAATPTVSDGWLGTDNALVKGKDGATVYLLRNGVSWANVTNKPKWWSQYKIQNQPNGSRVVTFVLQSKNCGASFEYVSKIDPLDFDNGKYAVPRPVGGYFGGWDRMEAYVDPFNGNIFASMNAAAAVADANGKITPGKDKDGKSKDDEIYTHFLFKSSDNGKTWTKLHEFGAWTPIVITSTPNGRVYLYSLMGSEPMISYSLLSSGNTKFSDWKPVHYKLFNLAPITSGVNGVYGCAVYKATNSISRVSLDANSSKVRISYPLVNGSNQTGVAIAQIEVSDTSNPVEKPIALIYGQNFDKSSILSSQFIEPDADAAGKTNKAAFYWVEAEPVGNAPQITKNAKGEEKLDCFAFAGKVTANYAIINSELPMGLPTGEFLSKTSTANRSWTVQNLNGQGRFYGDYAYGGSYYSNGRLHFLGQWREPDSIQANIVSIKP